MNLLEEEKVINKETQRLKFFAPIIVKAFKNLADAPAATDEIKGKNMR